MSEENILICGYSLDGKGGGQRISSSDPEALEAAKQLYWVHLDGNQEDTYLYLLEKLKLDPLTIDAMLAKETRPRIFFINGDILLILKGVNPSPNTSPEDMVSIRIYIQDHRIISVCLKKVFTAFDVEDAIQSGKGPASVPDFLAQIIKQLFTYAQMALDSIDAMMDQIEDEFAKNDTSDESMFSELSDVRSQAIIIKRYFTPQKEVISQLINSQIAWMDKKTKRILQERFEQITRYIEDLDVIRERSMIVMDEIRARLAEKSNHNIYLFSLVAIVFLPLTFITGLFGINVGGIPGSEYPYAFLIFCLGIFGIVIGTIVLFKKIKWL